MRNRQTQHGEQEIHAFRLFVASVNLNLLISAPVSVACCLVGTS